MKEPRNQINLQDNFLNKVRKDESVIKIILVGGDAVKGKIIGFDSFVIILDSGESDVMIYKHSIAAILPENQFKLF
ncbi:MAG: RNA chaperone Hfq [bacterium]|nr:RNA chaperone Hfq [bacterium]